MQDGCQCIVAVGLVVVEEGDSDIDSRTGMADLYPCSRTDFWGIY